MKAYRHISFDQREQTFYKWNKFKSQRKFGNDSITDSLIKLYNRIVS